MSIQWGATGFVSPMTHRVLDNNTAPTEVLQAGAAFDIEVRWEVPAALAGLVGPADTFRLRAFAESIGPGQEIPISELTVPGAVNQTPYQAMMAINPNPLLGEEQLFGGVPVSGIYNIVVVLQHRNAGVSTVHSGCSDLQPMVMFKAP